MTPTEINAAIAADLGWKAGYEDEPSIANPATTIRRKRWLDQKGRLHVRIPDHFHSLDAIQAAALGRFKEYRDICIFEHGLRQQVAKRDLVGIWQLTAADWCEAYLRAVGKCSNTEDSK